jgi:hypothetical protein
MVQNIEFIMKKVSLWMIAATLTTNCTILAAAVRKDYPITPTQFTVVLVADGFWSPRLETNRRVTIPYAFKKFKETGRIDNFAVAGGLYAEIVKNRSFEFPDPIMGWF